MKIWLAIITMTLTDTSSSLLVSKAMKQTGEISTLQLRKLLSIANRAVKNPLFVSGFFLQVCTFFIYLTVLSWADLSLVTPATSINYLIGIIGAKFFLKENVTKERWLGAILIGCGVTLVLL
ncbi:MAG: EamA family transporter [Rhizonema sp. PD38]|nr:EamA family transporter [Rhizonema sp. PD38]